MKYLDCKEKLNRWSKATYQVLYFVFWPICFPEIILYIAVSWKELIKYFIFLVWWSELCLRVRVGCRRFPHFKQFFLTGQPLYFLFFFKNSRMRRCCQSAGCVSCLSWVWGRTSTPLRSSWRKVPAISPVTCFGVNPMRPVWVRRCRLPAWWVTWNTHHESPWD